MQVRRVAHDTGKPTGGRMAAYFRLVQVAVIMLGCVASVPAAFPEELSRFERDRARMMLNIIKKDLLKYYYDESFHGLQLDDAFGAANEKIDQAKSVSQLMAAISRPLLQLNDSHTFFIPPGRAARIGFGWQMLMIGEQCYVTAVQEGSDAEAKGLKKGDLILEVAGHRPGRKNLWGMYYVHRLLAPRASLPLLIQSPGAEPRRVEVAAKVEQRKAVARLTNSGDLGDLIREMKDEAYLSRHRYKEVGESLLIWKMPQFDMTVDEVRTEMMRRVKKRPALILDLRNNGGGAVETLEAMIGGFVGAKTKIGDIKAREPQQPMVARKVGEVYEGKVVVLVDSGSGSASELFARMMQLTGRGKVIGDRTAGAVMESRPFDHMIGDNSGIFFATSITIADIIMSDGESLEHVGVVPDEVLLQTAEDLAAGHDPVLSRAASLCGVEIDPGAAGGYFPIEWKR